MRIVILRSTLAAAFFMAVCPIVTGYAAMPVPAPDFQIRSCQGISSYGGAAMAVDFRNDSRISYKTIVWRASFGERTIDFIDAGPFPAGRETQRTIWRSREALAPRQPQFSSLDGVCRAIEAQSQDGEIWTDPAVTDALAIRSTVPQGPLPTARPDSAPPVPRTFENPPGDPVGIVACNFGFDTIGRRGYGAMNVRFRNLSSKTVSRVVFRGLYGDGGVDFVFGGRFAPGVLISSNQWGNVLFGKVPRLLRNDLGDNLPPDFNDLDDNPMNCATVNVQYADGTIWQNTALARTVPLPTPHPSP